MQEQIAPLMLDVLDEIYCMIETKLDLSKTHHETRTIR